MQKDETGAPPISINLYHRGYKVSYPTQPNVMSCVVRWLKIDGKLFIFLISC
jgi:hypothetical protein